ncbi:hypothetical protein DFJ73DRAFT_836465 [Zopfochytrium polystomum]|nr:hypothetical protein DFJ73DRAFT_836465 [Zopfochytrium polystomum]
MGTSSDINMPDSRAAQTDVSGTLRDNRRQEGNDVMEVEYSSLSSLSSYGPQSAPFIQQWNENSPLRYKSDNLLDERQSSANQYYVPSPVQVSLAANSSEPCILSGCPFPPMTDPARPNSLSYSGRDTFTSRNVNSNKPVDINFVGETSIHQFLVRSANEPHQALIHRTDSTRETALRKETAEPELEVQPSSQGVSAGCLPASSNLCASSSTASLPAPMPAMHSRHSRSEDTGSSDHDEGSDGSRTRCKPVDVRISPYAVSIASATSTPSSTPRTSISITDLCNVEDFVPRPPSRSTSIDDSIDPDVKLAAEALGSLVNHGLSPLATAQTAEGDWPPHNGAKSRDGSSSKGPTSTQHFMQRVSNIPLVRDSITTFSSAYEATKNVSPIVKYSAETVESGVKTISKPVLTTLEPALGSLDRFACSQLDRLERNFPSMMSGSRPPLPLVSPTKRIKGNDDDRICSQSSSQHPASISTSPRTRTLSSPPGSLPTPSPLGIGDSTAPKNNTTAPHIDRKPGARSMWKKVVSGVGANFINDDTVRGLKWALKLLQDAAANIEDQIAFLRQVLRSLSGKVVNRIMGPPDTTLSSGTPGNGTTQLTPPLSPQTAGESSSVFQREPPTAVATTTYTRYSTDLANAIATVTREVVRTLRLVVEMLGRHAAAYLPPAARRSVREFIMRLPGRWAQISSIPAALPPAVALRSEGSSNSGIFFSGNPPQPLSNSSPSLDHGLIESSEAEADSFHSSSSATFTTAATSPTATLANTPTAGCVSNSDGYEANTAPPEAQRVLSLAAESSSMLQNVMSIFSQSVAGAEMVLGRSVPPLPTSPATASANFDEYNQSHSVDSTMFSKVPAAHNEVQLSELTAVDGMESSEVSMGRIDSDASDRMSEDGAVDNECGSGEREPERDDDGDERML